MTSLSYQTTIRQEAVIEGVGLHTGGKSKVVFRPAPANAGLRFFRMDLPGAPVIPARLGFVVDTVRGTTLGIGQARVHTVEHLLSAAAGLGIDNMDILLYGSEPPAADGSALPYVNSLLKAGLSPISDAPKRILQIPGPVRYEKEGSSYAAYPSETFSVSCLLLHDHPMLPEQKLELEIDPQTFLNQIAGARTFCFEHEIEFLKSKGLAQGGSLDNAVVIGEDRIHTNEEGLRFKDEFVRHKMLDLLGDLTLAGRSLIRLRLEVVRCGHTHNIRFAGLLEEAARQLRKSKTGDKVIG